jgi:hypothetical protein
MLQRDTSCQCGAARRGFEFLGFASLSKARPMPDLGRVRHRRAGYAEVTRELSLDEILQKIEREVADE